VSEMKRGLELKSLRSTGLDHRPWFLAAKLFLMVHSWKQSNISGVVENRKQHISVLIVIYRIITLKHTRQTEAQRDLKHSNSRSIL